MEEKKKNNLEIGEGIEAKLKKGKIYTEMNDLKSEKKYFDYVIPIKREGEVVGKVEAKHFLQPFEFFYIGYIKVEDGFKNQNIGKDILQNINNFLDRKNVPGILVDVLHINGNAIETKGMYQRSGWKQIIKYDEQLLGCNVDSLSEEQKDEILEIISNLF